jgi:hypothetical protein
MFPFCELLLKKWCVVKFLHKALRMAICDQDSDDPDVVKVTLKVKFTLEQVMKAQRGSRGIAVLSL